MPQMMLPQLPSDEELEDLPAELDEEGRPVEADVADPIRRTPEHWMEDDEVAELDVPYTTRHPDDWVISGPLGMKGAGRGHRFSTWGRAEMWAREFYGKNFKGRITEAANAGGNRWAFLIKGPRGVVRGGPNRIE